MTGALQAVHHVLTATLTSSSALNLRTVVNIMANAPVHLDSAGMIVRNRFAVLLPKERIVNLEAEMLVNVKKAGKV